jgi:hypothetical protein
MSRKSQPLGPWRAQLLIPHSEAARRQGKTSLQSEFLEHALKWLNRSSAWEVNWNLLQTRLARSCYQIVVHCKVPDCIYFAVCALIDSSYVKD